MQLTDDEIADTDARAALYGSGVEFVEPTLENGP